MHHSGWTPEYLIANRETCAEYLEQNWDSIPLANILSNITHGKVVRFKGMIQDMPEPEYFYSKIVLQSPGKETRTLNALYRDIQDTDISDYQVCSNDDTSSSTRNVYTVITTPALNSWVYDAENVIHRTDVCGDDSAEVENKPPPDSTGPPSKRPCTTNNNSEASRMKEHYAQYFPIPGELGQVFQVLSYEYAVRIKMHHSYDFVGFVSTHPDVHNVTDDVEDNELSLNLLYPQRAHFPRLHCIAYKNMLCLNPLYREDLVFTSDRMLFLRTELHMLLCSLLLGDELAAHYMVYHLMADIYSSAKSSEVLGKFAVNLSNIPCAKLPNFGKSVHKIMEALLPASHYFPISLDNMNKTPFVSTKIYEPEDCIKSGLLQLNDGTHLMLDETKLTAGQMNANGVTAVRELSKIIKTQKCMIDFQYYPIEYDVSIHCLVLSEGKSMLPTDYHVVLDASEDLVEQYDQVFESTKYFLKPNILEEMRNYLSHIRLQTSIIPTSTVKFLETRLKRKASTDDLHRLIVLARLISKADGKSVVDEDSMQRASMMEEERRLRIR